jgi:Predicted transcriptional regulators
MKKDKKKKRTKREQPESAEMKIPEPDRPEPAAEPDGGEEPLRDAIALVGGKWKLRILWVLKNGESLRYGTVKQQISGITDMMLSQSLRELTADGLAERRQYQQIPPKVEYCITTAGAELLPAIELLRNWALKHTKENA